MVDLLIFEAVMAIPILAVIGLILVALLTSLLLRDHLATTIPDFRVRIAASFQPGRHARNWTRQ